MKKNFILCIVFALVVGFALSTLFHVTFSQKSDAIKIQDDDQIIEVVASGDCYRVYRDTTTQTLYLYATKSGTFTIMKDLNGNVRFYEGK